jgi:hypothetical protein
MAAMAGALAAGWVGPPSCGWFEIEEWVDGQWSVKTMLRGQKEEIAEIYAGLSAKYGREFRVGAQVKRFRNAV